MFGDIFKFYEMGSIFKLCTFSFEEHAVAQLVEELRYGVPRMFRPVLR
jgi:hypothetical protein